MKFKSISCGFFEELSLVGSNYNCIYEDFYEKLSRKHIAAQTYMRNFNDLEDDLKRMFCLLKSTSASTFAMRVINCTHQVYEIRSKLNPIIEQSAKIQA